MDIRASSFFVSARGGVLEFVDADGVVVFDVFVPPGKVPAREYVDMLPDGCEVRLPTGLRVFKPSVLSGFVTHPASYDSGANPDYEPTSASRLETEMRLMLAKVQAESSRLDARAAALETLAQGIEQQAQGAPAADPAPVVE